MNHWPPGRSLAAGRPAPRRAVAALGLLLPGLAAALAGCGGAWTSPPSAELPWEVSLAPGGREGEAAVLVAVPYRSLVFRRDDGGYRADLLVSVVARRQGRRIGGEVAEATARVATAAEARSESKLGLAVAVELPGEGPAELEVRVRLVGTSRAWARRLSYPVPATTSPD